MHGTAHRTTDDFDMKETTLRALAPRPEMRAEAHPPDIGLSDTERRAVVGILNALLADEFVLYTKTRRFHWNVVGPNFSELHALLKTQYEQLEQMADDVAERARALGGIAAGSMEEYLDLTRLDEAPGESYDAHGMMAALLADHESLVRSLRLDLESCSADHGDEGTTDFLTGIMQSHETMAWVLRSHLG
jgi:starvation-inducible DNA-binding protein